MENLRLRAKDRRKHFKYIARRFVLPILVDVGKWVRNKILKSEAPEWEYLPGVWQEVIKDQHVRGWDAEWIVRTLTKTWFPFIESITAPRPFSLSNEAVAKGKPDLNFHNKIEK